VRWLLLLFIVVPLIELYLLLFVGSQIGFWPTVGIVLVTGTLGAALAKREGLRVWHSYREALSQGRLPDEGIVGGLLVLLGGALLITPGMLTDVVGFLLLVPQTRRFVADRIRAVISKKLNDGVVQVMSAGPGMGGFVNVNGPGPMDDGFDAGGPMQDPFEVIYERRAYDRGDVVDTEGVEVQQALLLGEGDRGEVVEMKADEPDRVSPDEER
jgi:UPF0716 protein FxsA